MQETEKKRGRLSGGSESERRKRMQVPPHLQRLLSQLLEAHNTCVKWPQMKDTKVILDPEIDFLSLPLLHTEFSV